MNRALKVSLFLLIITVVIAGCTKRFIPNTDIEDTEVNREIIQFCERYRNAVEDLNLGLLMSLASPRYFDNSGTLQGDDDMDRAGLEENLKLQFSQLKAIRHEIHYRDIFEQDGIINVEYYYTTNFQYEINGEKKWSNKTADNRLEIERVDNGFLIVSGM